MARNRLELPSRCFRWWYKKDSPRRGLGECIEIRSLTSIRPGRCITDNLRSIGFQFYYLQTQLKKAMSSKKAFFGFHESPITHFPCVLVLEHPGNWLTLCIRTYRFSPGLMMDKLGYDYKFVYTLIFASWFWPYLGGENLLGRTEFCIWTAQHVASTSFRMLVILKLWWVTIGQYLQIFLWMCVFLKYCVECVSLF